MTSAFFGDKNLNFIRFLAQAVAVVYEALAERAEVRFCPNQTETEMIKILAKMYSRAFQISGMVSGPNTTNSLKTSSPLFGTKYLPHHGSLGHRI